MAERAPSYWDAVRLVMDKISIDSADEFSASFAKVPRQVGIVYAAYFCLEEVRNGGFFQFFYNSTGVLGPEALEGFQAIGMAGVASAASSALDVFGSQYPRDREARYGAILSVLSLSTGSNFHVALSKGNELFRVQQEEIYRLSRTENGGFDDAATKYLAGLGLLGSQ